jgi:hypothetical protein
LSGVLSFVPVLLFGLVVFLVLFAGVAFALLPADDFDAVDFFVAGLEACVFLGAVDLAAVVLGFRVGFFASGFSPAFVVVVFRRGAVNVILSIATLV